MRSSSLRLYIISIENYICMITMFIISLRLELVWDFGAILYVLYSNQGLFLLFNFFGNQWIT